MTTISIITPCYNASSFLLETYESIKAQTYTDWEWVVVDDCSTDHSWEILQKFSEEDARVKIFQNKKNLKVSATRNRAIKESQGDFIALLDADDLWLPKKLENQLKWHLQGEAFTFHSVTPFNSTKEFKSRRYVGKINKTVLLKNNVIPTSSVMLNANLAKKKSFPTTISHGEDLLYFIYLLEESTWAYGHEENLSKYRLSSHSLSQNKIKMAFKRWQIYRKYLKINFFKSLYYFINYTITGFLKTIQ